MYLVTTANKETHDSKNEFLILGEWCKLYDDTNQKINNSVTMPFIWDKGKVEKANIYLDKLREKMLPKVMEAMNNYLGINQNERYYFIILNYWLAYYIDQLYDKYKALKNAFTKYNITEAMVLKNDQFYYSITFADFLNKSLNDKNDIFNFQMYSQIIEFLYPNKFTKINLNNFNRNYVKGVDSSKCYKDIIKNAKLFICSKKQKIFNLGTETVTILDAMLPEIYKEKLLSNQKKHKYKYILNDFKYKINYSYQLDKKSRSEMSLHLCSDEFESLLSELFFQHLPICFLEDHNSIASQINKMYIPKTDYYQGYLAGNMMFDFFYAQNQNIGILQHQHGGGYGVVTADARHKIEYKYSNKFLSFGWNGSYLTNPKLLLKTYTPIQNREYKLLFVQSYYQRYMYAMQYFFSSTRYIQEYLDINVKLINDLSRYYTIKTLGKGSDDFGIFFNERLFEKCKNNFTNISNQKFTDLIYKDNYILVSLDSGGTVFLEAMKANIPTVLHLNNEVVKYTQKFQSLVKYMKKVKIFHDSTESLNNHLKNINGNVSIWWFSSEVQKEKNKFIEIFARTNEDWIDEWVEFYKKLD